MTAETSYENTLVAEHRRLESMFAEVLGAIGDGEPQSVVRGAFEFLREALEAHVDQEDRLYYPALRALRPVHRAAIERLMAGHVEFRARLADVDATLAGGSTQQATAQLEALLRGFAAHEVAEETLLGEVDAELRVSAGRD